MTDEPDDVEKWAIAAQDGDYPICDLPERELVLRWLLEEQQTYANQKFQKLNPDDQQQMDHRAEMLKDGFDRNSFWRRQTLQYADRVAIFGVGNEGSARPDAGKQALFKMLTTLFDACACVVRVHGLPPAPGQTSGDIEPWDLSGY